MTVRRRGKHWIKRAGQNPDVNAKISRARLQAQHDALKAEEGIRIAKTPWNFYSEKDADRDRAEANAYLKKKALEK